MWDIGQMKIYGTELNSTEFVNKNVTFYLTDYNNTVKPIIA